ncbi:MAG: TlpA disulfide reductase family protein [Burkholderiales bacterium]
MLITPTMAPTLAPPLHVSECFNTDTPITLDALRGRVVVVHAFQMLCPECVAQGLPQAMKVHQMFPRSEVVVLGLHTVFEHHDAMGPNALKAFLHEYRIAFPVGVDLPATNRPVPTTMRAYGLRGTPSLVVIDRSGQVRLNHFGHMDDLRLGALLGMLLSEAAPSDIRPATVDHEHRVFAGEV